MRSVFSWSVFHMDILMICIFFFWMFLIYQDSYSQPSYGGGILLLLKLIDSRNGLLQHNVAFALADTEVVPSLLKQ